MLTAKEAAAEMFRAVRDARLQRDTLLMMADDLERAIVDRPAPTPTPAPGLDLDAVERAAKMTADREVFVEDGAIYAYDGEVCFRVGSAENDAAEEEVASAIVATLNAAPALIAEVRALRAAAEEREADMHARIRAGYDKTVADAWRAEVAKRDAEIADLRALVESQRRDYLDVCDAIAPETSGPADAAAKVRALRAKLAKAKRLGLEACALVHSAIDNAPAPTSNDPGDQSAIAAGHSVADCIAAALEAL